MTIKKVPKNIKFEEALAELEAQVRQLEDGDLPLEQALEVYKYGVELSRICTSKLDTVKKEVEKVVLDANSPEGYTTEAFEEEDE